MAERFNPDGMIMSGEYADTMQNVVLPDLEKRRTDRTLQGVGGRKIVVDRYDQDGAKGTVTIVHGFTEGAVKFSELTYSLLQNGYSVLVYDQRGHGRSWRDERVKDPTLVHVDRFGEYVEDLKIVCDQVLCDMPKPWFLFCHSMGGAVSTLFMEEYPTVFEKAVLCAPMIAPLRGGVPKGVAEALCVVEKAIGQGRSRAFISKPWTGPEVFEESCASGKERFDWYNDLRVRDPLYQHNGPSYSWTLEALKVTEQILAPGRPERVKIPVRLYTAEDDNQVRPEEQEMLAQRLPNCQRKIVPGSKHEIYRSPDGVVFPWWREILDFYGESR